MAKRSNKSRQNRLQLQCDRHVALGKFLNLSLNQISSSHASDPKPLGATFYLDLAGRSQEDGGGIVFLRPSRTIQTEAPLSRDRFWRAQNPGLA